MNLGVYKTSFNHYLRWYLNKSWYLNKIEFFIITIKPDFSTRFYRIKSKQRAYC